MFYLKLIVSMRVFKKSLIYCYYKKLNFKKMHLIIFLKVLQQSPEKRGEQNKYQLSNYLFRNVNLPSPPLTLFPKIHLLLTPEQWLNQQENLNN